MSIAYIISAYKLPEQLVRLVQKLNTEDTSFLIHVDKKTDAVTFARMEKPLRASSNVTFLERHRCHWGDFGHVKATLKGIQEILTQRLPADYVVLLTGQDYPIKSNHAIQRFFQECQGKSFIDHFLLPDERWAGNGGMDRILYWHFNWRNYHFGFPQLNQFHDPYLNKLWNEIAKRIPLRRRFPGSLKIYGGGSYWCLSRECIEYIHEFVQHHEALLDFFKYVQTPDELFFQTILLNSHCKDRIVNDDLRYIDWSKPEPPYPSILCKQDFELFVYSDKLFARKFDMTVDADVLDMIDKVTL